MTRVYISSRTNSLFFIIMQVFLICVRSNNVVIEIYIDDDVYYNLNTNSTQQQHSTPITVPGPVRQGQQRYRRRLDTTTDDDNNIDDNMYNDWETSYDANVTTDVLLSKVQNIQIVLLVPTPEHILQANNQHRSLSITNDTDLDINITDTTSTIRIIETFYKSGISFRKSSTSRRSETMWRGYLTTPTIVENNTSTVSNDESSSSSSSIVVRIGFCTVYEINGRIRAATFTTETDVYDMIYYNNKYEIRSSTWVDFPPEDDVVNDENEEEDDFYSSFHSGNRLMKQYDSIISSRNNDVSNNNRNSFGQYKVVQYDNASEWMTRNVSKITRIPSSHDRLLQNVTNITSTTTPIRIVDVLFVVTNRALCEYIGLYNNNTFKTCPITPSNRAPMDSRLQLSISETNTALISINVQVRISHIVYLNESSTYDPISDRIGINSISTNTDIQSLRTQTGADLVSVIAGRGANCGLAAIKGYRSIVNQGCLKQYTLSHEIGHNFGCNHDRQTFVESGLTQHQYAHALLNDPLYRTFLSYGPSTCPRVPYYSSSTIVLPNGLSLGNTSIDNLRMIQEQAPVISKWKSLPPTRRPTVIPTKSPTRIPTKRPTRNPTKRPTRKPTRNPSRKPTRKPTYKPTNKPSNRPITSNPTFSPVTIHPTFSPVTSQPTFSPVTSQPTFHPVTSHPTFCPINPTSIPITRNPTVQPTQTPTNQPILYPTSSPTTNPTVKPTIPTTSQPTFVSTSVPTSVPTIQPTLFPTRQPTIKPTPQPTGNPIRLPTLLPTTQPTLFPTTQPTLFPTTQPTLFPTTQPTVNPTRQPTLLPTIQPRGNPSVNPTVHPLPTKINSKQPLYRSVTLSPVRKPINKNRHYCYRTTCTRQTTKGEILFRMYRRSILTGYCTTVCVRRSQYKQYKLLGFTCGVCRK
jgi:Metallo-peptidase family M12B Reprolysin-like/PT repeat